MIREWLDRRRVRVTAHMAAFTAEDGTPIPAMFINVTNVGGRDVEITHAWIESRPPIFFDNYERRPLPRRLVDQEPWSTWCQLPSGVPVREEHARIRLSTGTVVKAVRETTMPAAGTVAGEKQAAIRAVR